MAKTIMVIDDSASIRQVMNLTLKKAGYDVIEACDGQDAISKLQGQKINLMICDVNMPNMDGISFLKNVKTSASYRFTPVIMLTTESQEGKKQEGKTAGAKAWVVKPFKPEQMLEAISKLIAP
ncbi:MAG: two-component system response regulator [Deltaproteobacteria bacterium GWC2_56_8]|nr:MAG: two-component system response regulator [Deltaproteobacteria bacterium GWB2_55_19]OGP37076.1 MAG: two-component system response regulator [Deltaproteobacteria bacterium GWC2_56_8]HAO93004.1 two-component system response regulator [Deltaproteobacteria bacterium]